MVGCGGMLVAGFPGAFFGAVFAVSKIQTATLVLSFFKACGKATRNCIHIDFQVADVHSTTFRS